MKKRLLEKANKKHFIKMLIIGFIGVLVAYVMPKCVVKAIKGETLAFGQPLVESSVKTSSHIHNVREYVDKPLDDWSMDECMDYISNVFIDRCSVSLNDVVHFLCMKCATGEWALSHEYDSKFFRSVSFYLQNEDDFSFKVINSCISDSYIIKQKGINMYLYFCGFSNLRLLFKGSHEQYVWLCKKGDTDVVVFVQESASKVSYQECSVLESDASKLYIGKVALYIICEAYDLEFRNKYSDTYGNVIYERLKTDNVFRNELEKVLQMYLINCDEIFWYLKDNILKFIWYYGAGSQSDKSYSWLCKVNGNLRLLQVSGEDETGLKYIAEPFREDFTKWGKNKIAMYVCVKHFKYKYQELSKELRTLPDVDEQLKTFLISNVSFRRDILSLYCELRLPMSQLDVIRNLVPKEVYDPDLIRYRKHVPRNTGIYLWLKGYSISKYLGMGSWGIVWQVGNKAYKVLKDKSAQEKMDRWSEKEAAYFNYTTLVPGEAFIYNMPLAKMNWETFAFERQQPLNMGDLKKFALQSVQAFKSVEHLHGLGYLHTDIKLNNFHVMEDDSIRLADFDLMMEIRNLKIIPRRGVYAPSDPIKYLKSFDPGKLDVYSLGYALLGALVYHDGLNPDNRAKQRHALNNYVYSIPSKCMSGSSSIVIFFELKDLYEQRGCIANLCKIQKCIISMIEDDCDRMPSLTNALRDFEKAVDIILKSA